MKKGRGNRYISILLAAVMLLSQSLVFCGAYNAGVVNASELQHSIYDYDCLYFGRYWQKDTNNDGVVDTKDSKLPIRWRILDTDGNTALLLCEYNIDALPFSDPEKATWQNSSLRTWLNGTFMKTAFNDNEKKAIQTSTVVTEGDVIIGTSDVTTTDKIYIPAIEDVTYSLYGFSCKTNEKDSARVTVNTGYTATKEGMFGEGEIDTYWLRSKGQYDGEISSVMINGYLNYHVSSDKNNGVRPMLRLNISNTSIFSFYTDPKNEALINDDFYKYPTVSCNLDKNNYVNVGRWVEPIDSYLYANSDGSFERVEYISGSIISEKYNDKYKMLSKKIITKELQHFGGVYFGKTYNYIVYGQDNLDENNKTEVVRVVKYDKSWSRKASYSLYGANTYVPFDGGTVRMAEYGDMLYIHTCHEIYKIENCHHQTNMYLAIDTSDMTLVDSSYEVSESRRYVSHSFNQFVLVDDEGNVMTLDHGDAYPRAVYMVGPDSKIIVMPIQNKEGNEENDTGVALGGFEYSDTSYLVAGNTVDQSDAEKFDAFGVRNIFVAAVNREDEKSTINFITDYKNSSEVSNPHLVKINNNSFLLMWSEGANVKYTFIDGDGNQSGKIYTQKAELSDCKPVVSGDKVVWYVTNNSEPVFYSINLKSVSTISRFEKIYTIKYVLDGGENSENNPTTYKANREVIELEAPTKEGFTFDGWFYDSKFTKPCEFVNLKFMGDITLYAKWIENEVVTEEPTTEATEEITTEEVIAQPTSENGSQTNPSNPSAVKNQNNLNKTPSQVSGLSAKNKKGRKITVKWKWKSDSDKYQIQYALNKKFTKGKKTKTVSGIFNSKTLTGLKKGKTYYVRVRGYNNTSDGKKYGKWSKVKKVKIKK